MIFLTTDSLHMGFSNQSYKHRNYFSFKYFFAEFERSRKMTWLDFISSFGGICGLCLGISFVSVIELLFWFSVKLCT